MCNNFKTLSQHDDYRYIARCEHGTVHLHWNRATLHMPQKDFLEVTSFLEDALHEDLPKARNPKAFYWMDNQAKYQVWLMGMGLYISAADFLMLVDMMRQAVFYIDKTRVAQQHQYPGNHQSKGISALLNKLHSQEIMFSLN